MLLREKNKPDAAPVTMGWDEGQAALQTGNFDVVSDGPAGVQVETAGSDVPVAAVPEPAAPAPVPVKAGKPA